MLCLGNNVTIIFFLINNNNNVKYFLQIIMQIVMVKVRMHFGNVKWKINYAHLS